MNDLMNMSTNEYFDAKEDNEFEAELLAEEYFPAQSMFIENEWITNSPGGLKMSESHDSSPFFETARINEEKVRFISPIQSNSKTPIMKADFSSSSSPKINPSILNELLPSQVQMEMDPINNGNSNSNNSNFNFNMTEEEFERKYLRNEKVYGQVFKGSLVVWGLFSMYLISRSSSSENANPINGTVGGWFACLLVIGLGLTACWARLLAEQTELVVYGLMVAVPAGFAALGVLSISHWSIIMGLVFFAFSGISALVVYFNRTNLKSTVEIVHNAAIFIQSTPKVYSLIIKVVAAYLIFLMIWLKSFVGLFSNPNWSFVFATSIKVSFIIILLWTGAVLSVVQKFILATWVRLWMNQTSDDDTEERDRVKSVDEGSFGSICLAAALLTVGKLIRLSAKSIHFTSKSIGKFIPCSGVISTMLNWAFSLLFVAEKFMQRFTDFAIYNLAINSETETDGFVTSCKQLGRVFEGHIGLAVTTDTTAQLLLSFSTALISFSSTAIILLIAKKHISWSSGLLIGLLAASVTDFVSNTYTAAIDSMFLCYLVDLRRPDKVIKPEIQAAFSTKLSSV